MQRTVLFNIPSKYYRRRVKLIQQQFMDCNKVRSSDNTPLIPLLDFDVQAIEHGVDATAEQHI
jgi:hypothetical protein